MYVSGTSEEAEEFDCDITFYDQLYEGNKIKSRYPLPVVSIKKSIWDIIEKGPVLSFTNEYVLENIRTRRWCWHLYTQLIPKKGKSISVTQQ